MNLAEAAVKVVGDFSGLRRQVDEEAAHTERTFGDKLKGGLGKAAGAGFQVAGAAATAFFAMGVKGAMELDDAMATYQATTGASAEQMEQARATSERLFRSNTESYEELGRVQASLRTQLQMTEEQIDQNAQSFLDFAKVTGQDNVTAIDQLADVMKAYNLEADEGAGLMDQLLVSHREFGTDVGEAQVVLAKMAPALQMANMSLDDGIGLMNLFSSAGLDASKMPIALQTALSKVESPEELQKLIDDIAATEDPFERGRLAAELFGERAGPQMAAALADGTFSLDDFIVTAEQAEGAVTEASDAFDSSFGRRAQLWIKNIKGLATSMLSDFGPAIAGIGPMMMALGPQMGRALRGLGKSVVGPLIGGLSSTLLPAITALGGTIGTAFSTAASIVIAAWPLVLLALVVAAIALLLSNPEIREKAMEVGGAIVGFIGEALGAIVGVLGNILGHIGEWAGGVASTVGEAGAAIVQTILGIPGAVAGWVGELIGQALELAGGVVSSIADGAASVIASVLAIPGAVAGWVGAIVGQAGDLVAGVLQNVLRGAEAVVRTILSIPGRAIRWVTDLIRGATRAVAGVVRAVVGMGVNVVRTILGIPGRVVGNLVRGFGDMGRRAVDAFLGFIRGIPEKVGRIIGGVGDFIGGLIPSFDVGASNVPRDMLAMVHKGEMIIPAQEAEAIRSGHGMMRSSIEGGGGDTHYHLTVSGITKHFEDPTAFMEELQAMVLMSGTRIAGVNRAR